MAQTSVAQFASELKVPPSVLLEQLRAAGVDKKAPEDSLSEQDKSRLLEHLRKMHGSAEQKNKITLTRKHTSEIKKADATGKYRTVQVEVRPGETPKRILSADTSRGEYHSPDYLDPVCQHWALGPSRTYKVVLQHPQDRCVHG